MKGALLLVFMAVTAYLAHADERVYPFTPYLDFSWRWTFDDERSIPVNRDRETLKKHYEAVCKDAIKRYGLDLDEKFEWGRESVQDFYLKLCRKVVKAYNLDLDEHKPSQFISRESEKLAKIYGREFKKVVNWDEEEEDEIACLGHPSVCLKDEFKRRRWFDEDEAEEVEDDDEIACLGHPSVCLKDEFRRRRWYDEDEAEEVEDDDEIICGGLPSVCLKDKFRR